MIRESFNKFHQRATAYQRAFSDWMSRQLLKHYVVVRILHCKPVQTHSSAIQSKLIPKLTYTATAAAATTTTSTITITIWNVLTRVTLSEHCTGTIQSHRDKVQ